MDASQMMAMTIELSRVTACRPDEIGVTNLLAIAECRTLVETEYEVEKREEL